MITVFVWWLVCAYVPTAVGAGLAIASLRSDHDYGYRGRHHARGRRRYAPSTFRLSELGVSETAELRAARVRVDQVAERIEERTALWSDERSPRELAEAYLGIDGIEHVTELHRHDPAAGAIAYLDISPAGVTRGRIGAEELPRHERIDTREMHLRFGDALASTVGPQAEPDEWVMPDEDGPDPGTGRHTRGRERVSA